MSAPLDQVAVQGLVDTARLEIAAAASIAELDLLAARLRGKEAALVQARRSLGQVDDLCLLYTSDAADE